jgi:two-component system chemotaxis response regulator CheY
MALAGAFGMLACLVVDDSKVVRMVARRVLEGMGLVVDEASDGQQAIAACTQSMPGLVLLGWEMLGMSGIDVLRALRAAPGGEAVRIVLCAAETDPERVRQCLEAGADEYVMKPFDGQILRTKLALLGTGHGAMTARFA